MRKIILVVAVVALAAALYGDYGPAALAVAETGVLRLAVMYRDRAAPAQKRVAALKLTANAPIPTPTITLTPSVTPTPSFTFTPTPLPTAAPGALATAEAEYNRNTRSDIDRARRAGYGQPAPRGAGLFFSMDARPSRWFLENIDGEITYVKDITPAAAVEYGRDYLWGADMARRDKDCPLAAEMVVGYLLVIDGAPAAAKATLREKITDGDGNRYARARAWLDVICGIDDRALYAFMATPRIAATMEAHRALTREAARGTPTANWRSGYRATQTAWATDARRTRAAAQTALYAPFLPATATPRAPVGRESVWHDASRAASATAASVRNAQRANSAAATYQAQRTAAAIARTRSALGSPTVTDTPNGDWPSEYRATSSALYRSTPTPPADPRMAQSAVKTALAVIRDIQTRNAGSTAAPTPMPPADATATAAHWRATNDALATTAVRRWRATDRARGAEQRTSTADWRSEYRATQTAWATDARRTRAAAQTATAVYARRTRAAQTAAASTPTPTPRPTHTPRPAITPAPKRTYAALPKRTSAASVRNAQRATRAAATYQAHWATHTSTRTPTPRFRRPRPTLIIPGSEF